MSSYDGRRSELRARLQGLANLITGQELVQLTALVEGLSSARDGGLAEVVAILTDSGSEARARDFASKLDEVHSRVSRVIADGLSALSQPTVVATQFCERIDREEDGFYVTLGATNAGGVRDKLLDAQGHLQEMTGVLARKWESLTDEDRRIEEAERAATGQLHEVIDRALVRGVQTSLRLGRALSAISQAVPRLVDRLNELPVTIGERLHIPAPVIKLYQFARELTNAVVQEAAKHGIPAAEVTAAIPNIAPGAGDLAADYVKEFFDLQLPEVVEALQEHVHVVTETLDSGYASQLQQYRAEVARQGTLLVTFSSTRQDVDGFIRDQGVESVRSKYEQADQAISSWASSSALTDGQRSDASAIAGAMPKIKPVSREVVTVKASTRPSNVISSNRGSVSLPSAMSARTPHHASINPPMPPNAPINKLSVNNCRINRRRPAPISRCA